LRRHPALLRLLRQDPLGEVEALLRLAQLPSHPADFALERLEPVQDLRPSLDLVRLPALAEALGPQPERRGEHHMQRGMHRLGLRGREGGGARVDHGEADGDGVPESGLEVHGSSVPWAPCGGRQGCRTLPIRYSIGGGWLMTRTMWTGAEAGVTA